MANSRLPTNDPAHDSAMYLEFILRREPFYRSFHYFEILPSVLFPLTIYSCSMVDLTNISSSYFMTPLSIPLYQIKTIHALEYHVDSISSTHHEIFPVDIFLLSVFLVIYKAVSACVFTSRTGHITVIPLPLTSSISSSYLLPRRNQ